ncbi:hypothetical protein MRB53_004158 [Persea americana]|uniref:Uncharacterized protein n=1 Tax=Persea americana TaxID=3435 RepID=A0ACC2MZS3_PERAE|nr:hypothetical protein MRB53_004158 [Persea americana]
MTRDELLREREAVINHLRANGFPGLAAAIVKPSALVRRHCLRLGLPYCEVDRIYRAAQRAQELPLPYSNMADTYASALIVLGTEGRITVQQVSHLTGRGVRAINQMIERLSPHQPQLFTPATVILRLT